MKVSSKREAESFRAVWEETRGRGEFKRHLADRLGVSINTVEKLRKSAERRLKAKFEPLADRGAGGRARVAKQRAATIARFADPVEQKVPRSGKNERHGIRHIVIPDTQIRKGVPTDHLDWIGQYIREHGCDVVVMLGDWFDFPSLSSHSQPGSLELEGARLEDDLKAGNQALAKLNKHLGGIGRRVMLMGNHEDRLRRAIERDPKWSGIVDDSFMHTSGWEVHGFLKPVVIDGVAYSHYWSAPNTGRAYGGTAANILNKVRHSFTQGHRQVFDYTSANSAVTGRELHGLIAGACYLHSEPYRGPQCNFHFRGIIVKNEVSEGQYDLMRVSLNYLCWRYTGEVLQDYMRKKYPKGDWSHLIR